MSGITVAPVAPMPDAGKIDPTKGGTTLSSVRLYLYAWTPEASDDMEYLTGKYGDPLSVIVAPLADNTPEGAAGKVVKNLITASAMDIMARDTEHARIKRVIVTSSTRRPSMDVKQRDAYYRAQLEQAHDAELAQIKADHAAEVAKLAADMKAEVRAQVQAAIKAGAPKANGAGRGTKRAGKAGAA